MRDVVAHVGIIDCALRLGFPSVIGFGIVRKNPNDMNVIDIREHVLAWIDQDLPAMRFAAQPKPNERGVKAAQTALPS